MFYRKALIVYCTKVNATKKTTCTVLSIMRYFIFCEKNAQTETLNVTFDIGEQTASIEECVMNGQNQR